MPISSPVLPPGLTSLGKRITKLASDYGPSKTELEAMQMFPGNPLEGIGQLAPLAGMVITPKTIELFRKLMREDLIQRMAGSDATSMIPNMALSFLKTRYPTTYNRISSFVPKTSGTLNAAEFVPETRRINFNPTSIENTVEDYLRVLGHEMGHATDVVRNPQNIKFGQGLQAILDRLIGSTGTTKEGFTKFKEFYEGAPGEKFANKVGEGAVIQLKKLREFK